MSAPRTYRDHPLAYLLKADPSIPSRELDVLRNTDAAIWRIDKQSTFSKNWLTGAINNRISDTADFSNAHAALAEIRTLGSLLNLGLNARPYPPHKKKGRHPDFEIQGTPVVVEVFAKEMNRAVGDKSKQFLKEGGIGGTIVISPAGSPKRNAEGLEIETTAVNVAQKFRQAKDSKGPSQIPPGSCGILWIDLQGFDWGGLRTEHCLPVTLHRGEFWSGGMWHAFYANQGVPILEGAFTEISSRIGKELPFAGRFRDINDYAAVVISMLHETVIFENPYVTTPLPLPCIETLLRLPGVDWQASLVRWPHESADDLRAKVEAQERELHGIREWYKIRYGSE
jgi:hypothetical protein